MLYIVLTSATWVASWRFLECLVYGESSDLHWVWDAHDLDFGRVGEAIALVVLISLDRVHLAQHKRRSTVALEEAGESLSAQQANMERQGEHLEQQELLLHQQEGAIGAFSCQVALIVARLR